MNPWAMFWAGCGFVAGVLFVLFLHWLAVNT